MVALIGVGLSACGNPSGSDTAGSSSSALPVEQQGAGGYRIFTMSIDKEDRWSNGLAVNDPEFTQVDGSGDWGSACTAAGKKPPCGTAADWAFHAALKGMAQAGKLLGHKMAAEHLFHYLDNKKSAPKTLNAVVMRLWEIENQTIKNFLKVQGNNLVRPLANLVLARRLQANETLKPGSRPSQIDWNAGFYFSRGEFPDQFYAIGGATFTFKMKVTVTKASGDRLTVTAQIERGLEDTYNWDAGKSITLFSDWCWKLGSHDTLQAICRKIEGGTSLEVNDKDIGRLHKLGMAREFKLKGSFSTRTYEWTLTKQDLRNGSAGWEAHLKTILEESQENGPSEGQG